MDKLLASLKTSVLCTNLYDTINTSHCTSCNTHETPATSLAARPAVSRMYCRSTYERRRQNSDDRRSNFCAILVTDVPCRSTFLDSSLLHVGVIYVAAVAIPLMKTRPMDMTTFKRIFKIILFFGLAT